jgi:non-specific serine/threonine protein kinase/serine/threonine-protein kinase
MADEPKEPEATLDESAPDPAPATAPANDEPPIGPYRLLRRLGEGGMGEVWLAEQTEPVRRRVALKVIKAGMDTKHVVARFEAERQALALMNHPYIARVFDAGTTPRGNPYFAMEFVEGEPITAFCERQRVTTRARLELFVQVCEGVQHAHQKGIIHRDIKPSNVLVASRDGQASPRIIDFGVAKATDQRLTEKTMYTELGALVGTPVYMSPEQAAGGDVDTRTDVYALGVLLYELLAGVLPFDPVSLRTSSLEDLRRLIRDVDPPRPSTRVSAGEGAGTRQLASRLRGDLDWITMKALEKDRARRYASPGELAADVRRHLGNEPVLAGPPSAAYRAGKFARRHRFGVLVAAGAFLLLASLAVTQTIQARRIARARDRADVAAATAKQTADFLVGLFRVADPGEARGQAVTAREILDRAADRVEVELRGEPVVRARLQATMSQAYKGLGLYERSVRSAERSWQARRAALGENDPATLAARSELGDSLRLAGRLDEAETQLRASVDGLTQAAGGGALETLVASLRLGVVLYAKGDLPAAEALLRASNDGLSRIGAPGAAERIDGLQWLGQVLRDRDRREEAVGVLRESLALAEATHGMDHPSTLSSLDALGLLHWDLGRLDAAETFLRQSLEASQRVLGPDHADTLTTTLNLGLVFADHEKFEDSERAYRTALEGYRRGLGPDHAYTFTAMTNLCSSLRAQKKFAEGEPFCREALAGRRRTLGENHPNTLSSINALGSFLQAAGRLPEAEAAYRQAFERRRRVLGPDHAATLISMANLGDVLTSRGKSSEAEPLLRGAAEKARGALPPTDPTLPNVLSKWGRCQAQLRRLPEARATLQEAVDLYRKTLGPDHSSTKNAEKLLAELG